MSDVETLCVWSEESAGVDDVLRALEELRRPEPMPATRNSVVNLCIVGTDGPAVERARAAVRELGGRHPARVLVLVLDHRARTGPPGLGARIELLGGEAAGKQLWCEEIELRVRGAAASHLHSVIEPLTLADLPVVVWFVGRPPRPDDPIVSAADVLLVDSRHSGGLDCFTNLVELAAHHTVVDLSWVRLEPWRALLAGLFEGPDFGPFVHHVQQAEITGRTGPRHLLAGWLTDRLGLSAESVTLLDAEHVAIRLAATVPGGRRGVFETVRGDLRRVEARAEIVGGPTASAVLELPEATPAWGLAEALSRLERDPVYECALANALS